MGSGGSHTSDYVEMVRSLQLANGSVFIGNGVRMLSGWPANRKLEQIRNDMSASVLKTTLAVQVIF